MSVMDINYTLETTDKTTDKDQLVVTSDICIQNADCHISNNLMSTRARLRINPNWERSSFKWSFPLKLGFCFVLI